MGSRRIPLVAATTLIFSVGANVAAVSAQGAHAGILCQWAIEMSVEATGRHCFAGHDQAFQAAISDSVGQIDAFIIKNEPMTAEGLAARKAAARRMYEKSGFCSPTATQFYTRFKSATPEQIKTATAELLAVPTKPTMEPCF